MRLRKTTGERKRNRENRGRAEAEHEAGHAGRSGRKSWKTSEGICDSSDNGGSLFERRTLICPI
jgi:hypothetical protein